MLFLMLGMILLLNGQLKLYLHQLVPSSFLIMEVGIWNIFFYNVYCVWLQNGSQIM